MAIDYMNVAIKDYEKATNKDLSIFLINVYNFFNEDYQNIFNWYSGVTSTPNTTSFKKLNIYIEQITDIINSFYLKRESIFKKQYHWELLYNLEDLNQKLQTTSNLSKILRSVITKNSFQKTFDIKYTTKKFDTLEKIEQDVVNSSTPQNDWWALALKNDLSENDYDSSGGLDISVPSTTSTAPNLSSVVDNPIGDKLYGIDFDRKIQFVDNDFKMLSYINTCIQSINVMLETRINTVPEMPEIGFDESLLVGTTKGVLKLPILQRQLLNMFSTDDTFSNVTVDEAKIVQDSIQLSISIQTVNGEQHKKTLTKNS